MNPAASKNTIPLSHIHSYLSTVIFPQKWMFSRCIFLTFQDNLSKNTIYDQCCIDPIFSVIFCQNYPPMVLTWPQPSKLRHLTPFSQILAYNPSSTIEQKDKESPSKCHLLTFFCLYFHNPKLIRMPLLRWQIKLKIIIISYHPTSASISSLQ